MNLHGKLMGAIGLMFLVSFGVFEIVDYRTIQANTLSDYRDEARALQGLIFSVRRVYQQEFFKVVWRWLRKGWRTTTSCSSSTEKGVTSGKVFYPAGR